MRYLGLVVLLAATPACLFEGQGFVPPGTDTRVTFLHTSDIHSRLFPFELVPTTGDRNLGLDVGNLPFGGAARLGYLIKRERGRADRVLHVDSGDCFQGAPVFNQNYGEAELRFLSDIGLNATVIGNHEFDAGILNLADKLAAWASFDVLAANYIFPDARDDNNHSLGRLAAPYSIYNLRGLKVAVIGMANLGSLTSIGEGGNSLQITPTEQNETVRSYVNLLHGSVDLVVVVTHLGIEEDEELVRGYEKVIWKDRLPPAEFGWEIVEELKTDGVADGRVLVRVPGVENIDLIFGGHLHTVLNPPKVVTGPDGRDVVISHSGAFAKFLGRLDVVVQDDLERGGKRLASHKYQIFPVDNRLREYEDTQTRRMLEPYKATLDQSLDLRRVMGYAPTTINRRSSTGNGDSGLGNLVAESMRSRRRVGAEFAVTNTLGIRDNFYRGPITLEDMFNVFPFENTLTVMYLSGAEVQELADFITERSAGRGCQSQAQVSGLRFTMNCGQVLANEAGQADHKHPGEEIVINGAPLDTSASYKVATNDYIAAGGSGFRVLKRNTTKFDTGVSLRSALIDYVGTLQVCGEYEVKTARYCLREDDFSKTICRDVLDCRLYDQAVAAGDVSAMPAVCEGGAVIKGAYADTPCVIGTEDGRLKRKTSDNLDQLEDDDDHSEEPQQ